MSARTFSPYREASNASPSRYRRRALTCTMPKKLRVSVERQRLRSRHDDVERGEELLQRHLERRTEPFVFQRGHACFDVVFGVEAIDAALQEEVAHSLASVGELGQLDDCVEASLGLPRRVQGRPCEEVVRLPQLPVHPEGIEQPVGGDAEAGLEAAQLRGDV